MNQLQVIVRQPINFQAEAAVTSKHVSKTFEKMFEEAWKIEVDLHAYLAERENCCGLCHRIKIFSSGSLESEANGLHDLSQRICSLFDRLSFGISDYKEAFPASYNAVKAKVDNLLQTFPTFILSQSDVNEDERTNLPIEVPNASTCRFDSPAPIKSGELWPIAIRKWQSKMNDFKMNDDGITDIVVGAIQAGPLGQSLRSPACCSSTDLAKDHNRESVPRAGDVNVVNDDGSTDTLIGAPAAPPNNLNNIFSSKPYLIFGMSG